MSEKVNTNVPIRSGHVATLSYDDSTLKKRHNFTIYLETSGNANVYSRLLSVKKWE